MTLININEASIVSGKSIQTIRRMIKHKRIQVRRQKTPQGFNYLIIKESLLDYISRCTQPIMHDALHTQDTSREHRPISQPYTDLLKAELDRFGTTIQKLIEQSEKDKENFFHLIKTFQDRVVTLENQIKMLEAPEKYWWQIWK